MLLFRLLGSSSPIALTRMQQLKLKVINTERETTARDGSNEYSNGVIISNSYQVYLVQGITTLVMIAMKVLVLVSFR